MKKILALLLALGLAACVVSVSMADDCNEIRCDGYGNCATTLMYCEQVVADDDPDDFIPPPIFDPICDNYREECRDQCGGLQLNVAFCTRTATHVVFACIAGDHDWSLDFGPVQSVAC